MGRSGPYLMHGSLGPPESTPQTASRSVQPFCRTAVQEWFNRIRQVAPMCTPCNTCFLGPTAVHNANSIWISSVICAQPTSVSSDMPGHVISPKHCPFAWSDLDPHLIHGSLDPPESKSQAASRSVQPFYRPMHYRA